MYIDRRLRRMSGLSLIELVFFIVIVSVAIAGVLSVLNVTVKRSADPQLRKQALAIAEALLEEIEMAGMTYCDIADPNVEVAASGTCTIPEAVGPEPTNTSRPYDNVNDYVTAYNTPQTMTGDVNGTTTMIPNGYTASVSIIPEPLNGIASSAATPDVLRIAVTIRYGSDSITLEGYRTRYAPNTPNAP